MVANLLLTRAGRARPMRCSRRTSFLRTGYQPSRLSMSILAADAEEGEETNFEDDLAREYRQLARGIPTKALLGEELTPKEQS